MYSIAIDGPAGAGKTTQAKAVANRLGFLYVDTGALYRAVALGLQEPGLAEDEVSKRLDLFHVQIQNMNGIQHVFLNGEDVTNRLRTERVSMLASAYSAMSCVRAALLSLQRDVAMTTDVVMEGRDIGTVVIPFATLKIFLTADSETRAIRRAIQIGATYEEIPTLLKNIRKRDYDDTNRAESPLRQAEDAILIDCTDLCIGDVTEKIINLFYKRQKY